MAFSDFRFPQVQKDLGLDLVEADISSDVEGWPVREDFARTFAQDAKMGMAINTEKAKSEFIIAPILAELRRSLDGALAIFSGTELNVDPSRGLNGVCDFILSRAPHQLYLASPLVMIVEAKNDNIFNGLGQCIASMVAAHLFNEQASKPSPIVHGAVTTGNSWRFLRLEGTKLTLDLDEYHVGDLPKLLGLLRSLVVPGTIEANP